MPFCCGESAGRKTSEAHPGIHGLGNGSGQYFFNRYSPKSFEEAESKGVGPFGLRESYESNLRRSVIQIQEKLDIICRAGADRKAEDILIVDVGRRSAMCESFVLMTASSTVRVKAVVESIEEAMEGEGVRVLHKEGLSEATWVLMDYGSVVVHVFHPDMRQFYGLEKLWGDAPSRPYLTDAPTKG